MTTGDYKKLKRLVKGFIKAVGDFTQFSGSGGPLESRNVPNQAKEQWKRLVLSGDARVVSDEDGPKIREWIDGITFTLPLAEPAEPPPDYNRMFLLAEHYSEASEMLEEQGRRDGKVVANFGCSGPKIMVDSFAIEVYLKCLYVMDRNEKPHGHDWREIFDSLKDFTRRECRATYDRDVNSGPLPMIVRTVNPDATWVLDFNTALDVAKDTYAGRRYLYEEISASGWKYAHFLRQAIRKVAMMDIKNARVAKNIPDRN